MEAIKKVFLFNGRVIKVIIPLLELNGRRKKIMKWSVLFHHSLINDTAIKKIYFFAASHFGLKNLKVDFNIYNKWHWI